MSRPPYNSSNSRSSSVSLSSLRSGLRSASKQLKTSYQNVTQSVATVQANRASNGPQGNFLAQVKDQIVLDRTKRRDDEEKGTQRLALFPGWAVRRLELGRQPDGEGMPFKIDVFVSGYAYSMRPPDRATRSQKAFLRVAKAFASLPKLPAQLGRSDSLGLDASLSRSTEELLKLAPLPPRPEEMTPDREAEVLRTLELTSGPLEPPHPKFLTDPEAIPPADVSRREKEKRRSSSPMYSHRNSSSSSLSSTSSTASRTPSLSGPPLSGLPSPEIIRLHNNFQNRLRPFWARMLTRGKVLVSIYTMNVHTGAVDRHLKPLATLEIPIVPDTGYFGAIISIPFDTICDHPGSVHIAFGDQAAESHLAAIAEYVPPPPPPPQPGLGRRLSMAGDAGLHAPPVPSQLHVLPPPVAQIEFALTDARVRLISDIDDTIKISSILHGVRAVFRNVFVRHLDELACPGMPEFYQTLASRGVRFHYVSNSPFELLPVLSEFLKVIGYPAGSLKLKYYGGSSLFKGLWEPAGERKRAGVVEVMDYFPEAKFFLVGDSGEQDMELYTALAKEFHSAGRRQILGIFIRDVNPEPTRQGSVATPPATRSSSPARGSSLFAGRVPVAEPSDSGTYLTTSSFIAPVGNMTSSPSPYDSNSRFSMDGAPETTLTDPTATVVRNSADVPRSPPHHQNSTDSVTSDPAIAAAIASAAASTPSLTKKRAEFRVRLAKAREGMPPDVPFIIFVHPDECNEIANNILDSLRVGGSNKT